MVSETPYLRQTATSPMSRFPNTTWRTRKTRYARIFTERPYSYLVIVHSMHSTIFFWTNTPSPQTRTIRSVQVPTSVIGTLYASALLPSRFLPRTPYRTPWSIPIGRNSSHLIGGMSPSFVMFVPIPCFLQEIESTDDTMSHTSLISLAFASLRATGYLLSEVRTWSSCQGLPSF